MLRVGRNVQIDEVAIAVRNAIDDGQILFLNQTLFELLGQTLVGPVGLRGHHNAGRVAVQTVYDARTRGAAQGAQLAEMKLQGA